MKTVAIVPLNESNYPTWKVQCQMALVREGLWGIVAETETIPVAEDEAGSRAKFIARRDGALAIIVLAVDTKLLYLLGEPTDPVDVWTKLQAQFQKKTWANKLALRRRLHSLQLKDGDSVQEHIKTLTELFNELAVVGDVIKEEDRVVYLLASLPDSFNTLVTALEANEDVPKMEVVTERLLHAERKRREKDLTAERVMTATKARGLKCFNCKKFGHIQRHCPERSKPVKKSNSKTRSKDDKGDSVGLLAHYVLGASELAHPWIVDSGATSHISNSRELYEVFQPLEKTQQIILGDGRRLEAVGIGVVALRLKQSGAKSKVGRLKDVLYVPDLAYNLLSVPKVTEAGKEVTFDEDQGVITDDQGDTVAMASKTGSLYYLNCEPIDSTCVNSAATNKVNETLWHRRFGHLGERGLRKLAKDNLVNGFDYDPAKGVDFCESCVRGKIHRCPFPDTGRERATKPLGIVHSDVCGKLNSPSLGGAEHFVTFIDDKTHYVWIYVLKHKHEVFRTFKEWKSLVENSSGHKVKVLRTDNGGEYMSTEFETFLKAEGIKHEYSIPKTPEQNGVSERMNCTLVEAVRSMLDDSKLPHRFWAEALATAAYLVNRSPTKTLGDKTPFEAWFGKKPCVKHIRVFGCVAYSHISKDERKKLDSKATKCIFLGYATQRKGYRLYNTETATIIHSRDVVFNESSRGIESEHEEIRPIHFPIGHEEPEMEAGSEPVEQTDCEFNRYSDVSEPPVSQRTSSRVSKPPDYYGMRIYTATELGKEPETVTEALSSTEKEQWRTAMQKEMDSIHSNDVWDLVELPKGHKPVGSKWVFKRKTGADGSIERYKARLVAQGFTQKQGLDYDETFSPVIRFELLRSLIALAVQKGLKLHQLDITAAFLNGHLEEEVFMRQPDGFVEKGKEHLVCRLKHSLY